MFEVFTSNVMTDRQTENNNHKNVLDLYFIQKAVYIYRIY